ncbi:MAG: hypothetical protein AAF376_08300 [Pseudomonadota bacterium]
MQDLVAAALAEMREEIVGVIGSALFFGSWILQAIESRRVGRAVVSIRFFTIRAVASLLLGIEGVRLGSISLSVVMAATGLLMIYNIVLELRADKSDNVGKDSG